jgi:hypothetical protein
MFLVLRYSLVAAAYAAMGWSRMTEDDAEPPWNPDQPGKNERMIAGGPSTLRYLFTPGLPPREKA